MKIFSVWVCLVEQGVAGDNRREHADLAQAGDSRLAGTHPWFHHKLSPRQLGEF